MSGFALLTSALGSLLLGGVFLAAALPKLRNPRGFALNVVDYHVLPMRPSITFARIVPPLELLASLLLFSGVAVRWAAALLAVLLVSFCLAVAITLARGREIDCGCFGASTKHATRRVRPALLLQDVALVAVALVVFATAPGGLALAPWSVWSVARLAGSWQTVPLAALLACAAATIAVTVLLSRPRSPEQRPLAREAASEFGAEEQVARLDRAR